MQIMTSKSETSSDFFDDVHKVQRASLSPGSASLDQLSDSIRALSLAFLSKAVQPLHVDLFAWVRHIVTASNTTACFGANNPFREDPKLEETFW